MTDQELYKKAKFYGQNALLWRQKFLGLLPEVQKRRLYLAKGFGSVFEFAFKLAGVSEEQVRRVLNLERKFMGTPVLKSLLESGEVSVNKLARVASIASPQNEVELAEAVQLLPKSAVETLVRDEKSLDVNSFGQPLFDEKSVPGHTQALQISEAVKARLAELQEKAIDLSALLTELLDKREAEIAEEKASIRETLEVAKSRHVSARIKRLVQKENGTKCSIPTCTRPAEQLHHTQTFALSHRHDPHYLAPLCKDHHTIAHAINVKVWEKREQVIRE